MTLRVRTMLLFVVLPLAIGAAGCGSSKSSSSKAPAITKAEFLAKGNALCNQTNRKNQAVVRKLGNSPTRAQIVAYANNTFVPDVQAAISGIRALGAPAGDEATVTSFLDAAQADLNKVKANPLVIGSPAARRLFANFAKPAHAYGLTQCARNA